MDWPADDRKSAMCERGTNDNTSLPALSVSVMAAGAPEAPLIQQPEIVHNGHGVHRMRTFFPTSWSITFVSSFTLPTGLATVHDFTDADDPLQASFCAWLWTSLADSCAWRRACQIDALSPGRVQYEKVLLTAWRISISSVLQSV